MPLCKVRIVISKWAASKVLKANSRLFQFINDDKTALENKLVIAKKSTKPVDYEFNWKEYLTSVDCHAGIVSIQSCIKAFMFNHLNWKSPYFFIDVVNDKKTFVKWQKDAFKLKSRNSKKSLEMKIPFLNRIQNCAFWLFKYEMIFCKVETNLYRKLSEIP